MIVSWEMGPKIKVFLSLISIQVLIVAASTNSADVLALKSLMSGWTNTPPNWVGSDPCGGSWEGISCTNSRVTSLDLSNNKGLTGTLPQSIGNLTNLSTLMLIGCSFFGLIPDSIGSLQQLTYLSLNSNNFSGPIPNSIGNLNILIWLDVTANQLNGTIPISKGTTTGLDMLVNTKHFHLGQNQLVGSIPSQLFNPNMQMIHVILDNNLLTDRIPYEMGNVQTLEVVRLNGNSLNGSVPANLNYLTSLSELYLANNNLTGVLPNLTGMDLLNYVDMSNNSFDASSAPPWFTSLQSLTTLMMERTQLQGHIPVNLFSLPQLQTVVLSNNQLNGTLNVATTSNSELTLVDCTNNVITNYTKATGSTADVILAGNPICNGTNASQSYCSAQNSNSSSSIPSNYCPTTICSSNEVLSPNCTCAFPLTGTLHFISFSFSNLENSTYSKFLVGTLMSAFLSSHLPVDSVAVSDPTIDMYSYLQFTIQIFPSGQDEFNRTAVSGIGTLLNLQPFQIKDYFGPFFFISENYCCFADAPSSTNKSSNAGIIAGAAVGGSVLVLLLIGVGIYAYRQKKRVERTSEQNPFASWESNKTSGDVPQLKGAKLFSFEELEKCTDNFSEANVIGAGGYGKVYKGTIASGQLVAIKRAQQGSLQGALEFKTEIELLSRINHKNVVELVGFCYEQGEQMLVYEYVPNGTLNENLAGKERKKMDWMRRLSVALDSARGLAYLHELANPPIIHRDIKSNNILLDDQLTAKVADFGLSKLRGDIEKGYVTTQVKGTLGYMDPEYYMTQQLTEKSDVYSFGVVLLELVTGRAPIARGKHIVRVVNEAMDGSEDPYSNLQEVLDPNLDRHLVGLEKFVELAMSCVSDSGAGRPTMGEVVREIENIIQMAGMNLDKIKSANTISSDYSTEENIQSPYSGEDPFHYSMGSLPFNVESH
ncbi:leucine-rich repeat receptor protein kinase HPCA1-like isoform X2 [Rhododendron vialii]|uniref:leucine-rich repeat receptor protein kinase HPCA1-like isoform X2 n=1 Tax=Rhododendron vialii TaxID=182163 RepID=UPI00265E945F|nr:leucine-rich repeat receptor protein kinase HPCA1-like isoform X2 [Rhododendron vialii]